LNAAYFTKPKADANRVRTKIMSTMHTGDEAGLSLYAWKSLVERSNVIFRQQPSFYGRSSVVGNCREDCGRDVPLTSYTYSEIQSLINESIGILTGQGFSRPKSAHIGGWLGSKDITTALLASGIQFDFSTVPLHLLNTRLK